MRNGIVTLLAFAGALGAGMAAGAAQETGQGANRSLSAGAVYTMSNAVGENAILVFERLADGRLVSAGSVPTGGNGTGAGLGSQGALALTRSERWLLAVNPGSDTLSVFEVERDGLRLADVQPSGGVQPVSVTEHNGLVYTVHAGSDSIAGFRLGGDGRLDPLEGSARTLSGTGVGPAQIAFTPDGSSLLVTEKNTNALVTFAIAADGLPAGTRVQGSAGTTPFGFAFGKRGQVFVTEAFGGEPNVSATSSYEIDDDGTLTPLSASVGAGQTAACWVALTPDGRFAYVTNTGSGSITGYAIDVDGQIQLLDQDGRTGNTGDGSTPIDVAVTGDGRYLYNQNIGSHTISAFRIQVDGSLTPLPFTTGLPEAASGLVSR